MKDTGTLTKHIKSAVPRLFNHAIINSGNGWHVYISVASNTDVQSITDINKTLASILGADIKAASPTQIVRIPYTLNFKDPDSPLLVKTCVNTVGTNQYKPYTIDKIHSLIKAAYKTKQVQVTEPPEPPSLEVIRKPSVYYCCEQMLKQGVKQGNRNFALGRLTKYLQLRGYQKNAALQAITQWNARCQPPKNENEVKADFEKYWEGNYKLLGCRLSDAKQQEFLNSFCDQYQCTLTHEKNTAFQIDGRELEINNAFLSNKFMRELSGNDFLLLTILHLHDTLTKEGLRKELTGKKKKRPCMAEATLNKSISNLARYHFIEFNGKTKQYQLKKKFNALGMTRYYFSASILRINGIITQAEFKTYMCLVRNLFNGESASYDILAEHLQTDKHNIKKYIDGLYAAHAIHIRKVTNERGLEVNRYTLVA